MPARRWSKRWLISAAAFATLGVLAAWPWLRPKWTTWQARELLQIFDGKRWGYVTTRGVEALPCVWESAGAFDQHGTAWVSDGDRHGMIDAAGKVVVPLEAWLPAGDDDGEWLLVRREDGKRVWIDRQSRIVLPFEWDEAQSFEPCGLARVTRRGKSGWIDRQGRVVVPLEWDFAYWFGGTDRASVCRNRKWGAVDRTGKLVVPCEWDSLLDFSANGLSTAKRGERWCIVDRAGKVVVPLEFEYVESFWRDGTAKVRRDGKNGLIDSRGRVVVPCLYEEMIDCDERGWLRVRHAGKYGWIDRAGKEVVPCVWDDTSSFIESDDAATVRANGKWGVLRRDGSLAVPPVWDSILFAGQPVGYRMVGLLTHPLGEYAAVQWLARVTGWKLFDGLRVWLDPQGRQVWRSDVHALWPLLPWLAAGFGTLAGLSGWRARVVVR